MKKQPLGIQLLQNLPKGVAVLQNLPNGKKLLQKYRMEQKHKQHFHNIIKFLTSLSHPLSNKRTRYGWAQRKSFNIGTPSCPEKTVLGAFVVNSSIIYRV